MNGYERICAVLNRKPVDRVPMMLHNFMAAAEEAGISMREYREDPKKMARVHIDMARKYDLDGVLLDVDTCLEAGAVGVPIDFPEHEPARVIRAASDDIEELIEMMDSSKVRKDDRIKKAVEAVYLMKQEVGGELFVRGNCDQMAFSLAMLAYGMEDFMADLLDEECEEGIFRLMDRAYEVHLEFHKMMQEAGADMTSFGDSSTGPDLISREMYRKYALPYHKRLQKDLKDSGVPVLCHICGKTDIILEDLAEVGFDAVELDYKTDIEAAHRILQGKSVLFGPIDPSGIFFAGTADQVRKETERVFSICGGKELVIGAGCALPAGVPEENLRIFSETVKNYR